MTRRKVTVKYVNGMMYLPAEQVPPLAPVRDVSAIVLNGYTTSGIEGRRVFVPEVTTSLVEHRVGFGDPWPYHLRCTACGAVFGYFDCYSTTGERRALRMHFCMRCGARVEG